MHKEITLIDLETERFIDLQIASSDQIAAVFCSSYLPTYVMIELQMLVGTCSSLRRLRYQSKARNDYLRFGLSSCCLDCRLEGSRSCQGRRCMDDDVSYAPVEILSRQNESSGPLPPYHTHEYACVGKYRSDRPLHIKIDQDNQRLRLAVSRLGETRTY